jgi:hypothetical protein
MELGAKNCTTGEAYAVKVVAALAMVDGGVRKEKTSWKPTNQPTNQPTTH